MHIHGQHCLLECYDCPRDLLDDADALRAIIKDAADTANTTVRDIIFSTFEPSGVTVLALLAESHLSIHTWPELGYAAVDCFTCGEKCDPQAACEQLVVALQAGRHVLKVVPRGEAPLQARDAATFPLGVASCAVNGA